MASDNSINGLNQGESVSSAWTDRHGRGLLAGCNNNDDDSTLQGDSTETVLRADIAAKRLSGDTLNRTPAARHRRAGGPARQDAVLRQGPGG